MDELELHSNHRRGEQIAAQSTASIAATLLASVAAAWPIGSVFISAVATNPATLLGVGTWTTVGAGRVLVGIDAGQTEFDSLGETGGAKTHTLTTAEMPAHTHTYTTPNTPANSRLVGALSSVDGVTAATATGSTGDGTAHNNLQPYLVVSMWQRTA